MTRCLSKYLHRLFAVALVAFPTLAQAQTPWWRSQQYWDGVTSPPLRWTRGCHPTAEDFSLDNPAYASPPLMAIGDSLYNGVQSLKINWWLSEWSAPNLVAIRMGLIEERAADRKGPRRFYGPQYPKHGSSPQDTLNFGFNLERSVNGGVISRWSDVGKTVKVQADILRALKSHIPQNRRGMVDNIAFSGANTLDLLYWTPKDYQSMADAALDKIQPRVVPRLIPNVGAMADAFSYGNAAFVLNPMRDKCLDNKTPIEQVELRRPQRLLVNIGSNNGLYKVAFLGTDVDDKTACGSERGLKTPQGRPHCVTPIRKFLGSQYEADMRALLGRLERIKGLNFVYINNIALPSQVANVVPSGKDNYKIDIIGSRTVNAEIIRRGDDVANAANNTLKRLIGEFNRRGRGPEFVLVDVYKALNGYDYKGCGSPNSEFCKKKRLKISANMSGTKQNVYLDNRPMIARGTGGYLTGEAFASKLLEGGLFSFDNMHLSSVGYEIMAETVHEAIEDHERLAAWPKDFDPSRCVDGRKFPELKKFMRPGDCVKLLTKPGWSFTDATRRDFVFQRIASDEEMKSLRFFKILMAFAN